jgi:tetratricopeptide (TPR) repeat protein
VINRFFEQKHQQSSVRKILELYEEGKKARADEYFEKTIVDLNIEPLAPDNWTVWLISEQLQWAKIFYYRSQFEKAYEIFQRYERLIHDKDFRVHIKSWGSVRMSWIDTYCREIIKDLYFIQILLYSESGQSLDVDSIINEFRYDNPGSVGSSGSHYGNLAKLGIIMTRFGSLDDARNIYDFVSKRCNPYHIENNCYLQSQILLELGENQAASQKLNEAFMIHKHTIFVGSGIGPKQYFESFLKLNDRETLIEMVEWFFQHGRNSRVGSINKDSYDFTKILYVNEPAKSVDKELFLEIQELYSENLLILFDEFATYSSASSSLSEPLSLIQDIIKAKKTTEAKEMVKIILYTIQVFILENFPEKQVAELELTDYEDVTLWDRDHFYKLVKNSSVIHLPSDANIFDYLDVPDELGGKRGVTRAKRDSLLRSLNQIAKIIRTLEDHSLDIMFRKLYNFLRSKSQGSSDKKSNTSKPELDVIDSKQMEYKGTKMQIEGLLPKLRSNKSDPNETVSQLVKLMNTLSTYGLKRKYYY